MMEEIMNDPIIEEKPGQEQVPEQEEVKQNG